MRNLMVGVVVVVVVVGIAVMWWQRASSDLRTPATLSVGPPAGSTHTASVQHPPVQIDATPAVPGRVRRIAPAERERLATAIARARAQAAATPPPADPSLGSADEADPQAVLALIIASLDEIRPFLKECYAAEGARTGAAPRSVRAAMTLVGDANVGALIEKGEVSERGGEPLAEPYAECLRETLASLALPSEFEGGEFQITMTWDFDE